MRITRANVLTALSAGAIFVVGCSSDEENGIYLPTDSGTVTTGGGTSTGGRNATGGRAGGTGGRSTGGSGAGGAGGSNTGGSNAGGTAAGGTTTDAGTGGTNAGGSGTGGAATGGAGPDASAGGTPSTGGAQNTGGSGTGGASTGGAQNTGGASTGGAQNTGGASTGGAQNTGGASTGGAQSTGGAPTDAGTGDASTEGGGVQKSVFVTSGAWDSNLKTAGAAATGLEGADKLCNAMASAAGLGGNWRAWLSTSTVNAIDCIADVGPWYRLDGELVFANKAAMTGNPTNPIDVDENRHTPGDFPHQHPWTGTQANGTKAANLCGNWESVPSGSGECGQTTSKTPTWTDAGGFPCSVPYPLYCFEQ